MKKIVIIYGSSTGTTQAVAEAIASRLGVKDVFDAATITKGQVEPYDVLILGTSTWGDGELQDDWYEGVKVLKSASLAGKDVAFFGCGDSMAYSDTFCNGMHLLKEELEGTGCNFIGGISADGKATSPTRPGSGLTTGLPLSVTGSDISPDHTSCIGLTTGPITRSPGGIACRDFYFTTPYLQEITYTPPRSRDPACQDRAGKWDAGDADKAAGAGPDPHLRVSGPSSSLRSD